MKNIAAAFLISIAFTSIASAEPSGGTGTAITIPGTYTWKVGEQTPGKSKNPDFFWEQASPTQQYLKLQNGARAAVVDTPFDSVDAKIAKATDLPLVRIDGEQLRPGRVVVFKTDSGRLGKFVVVGYTPLKLGNGKVCAKYNLQIRWLFF